MKHDADVARAVSMNISWKPTLFYTLLVALFSFQAYVSYHHVAIHNRYTQCFKRNALSELTVECFSNWRTAHILSLIFLLTLFLLFLNLRYAPKSVSLYLLLANAAWLHLFVVGWS